MNAFGREVLVVRSGISKFHYSFETEGSRPVGALDSPDGIAMPRNPAVKNLVPKSWEDHVQISVGTAIFRVEYERLSNHLLGGDDLRFFLMSGADEIARASIMRAEPSIALSWKDQEYEFLQLSSRLSSSMDYDLGSENQTLGTLRQTTRFLALKRSFQLEFDPEIPTECVIFCFFLAANRAYK